MSAIFLLVWISGFFIELHPDAYRDIFFNFSSVYLLVAVGFIVAGRVKGKSKK